MGSLSLFDLIAVLLVLTAVFGWINYTVFKLPQTIGLLVMALAASLVMVFRRHRVAPPVSEILRTYRADRHPNDAPVHRSQKPSSTAPSPKPG